MRSLLQRGPMRTAILQGFNPWLLPGNEAIYSLRDALSDNTYLIDGSNRLMLVADRSGKSAVNGLRLDNANNNNASSPDSAAVSVTGDLAIRVKVALDDWTPGARNTLINKWLGTGSQQSFLFNVETNGLLRFVQSTTGGDVAVFTSSVAPAVSDFGTIWLMVKLDVDNGAAGRSVTFWTSQDGVTWTQLGTTQTTGTAANTFDGTAALYVGGTDAGGNVEKPTGMFYYADIRNTLLDDGTGIVWQADFSRQAKLAASFVESSVNGATVTINTSGDLGARICGARDLYQGTAANQPIFSVLNGYNIATFDGVSDYMRAATFPLVQPTSIYMTWALLAHSGNAYDGNTVNAGNLQANGPSPRMLLYAGSSGPTTDDMVLGTKRVTSGCYNGASSTLAVNLGARATGNAGSNNMNGYTLGARGDVASYCNMRWSDTVLRSVVDSEALDLRIRQATMRANGVS